MLGLQGYMSLCQVSRIPFFMKNSSFPEQSLLLKEQCHFEVCNPFVVVVWGSTVVGSHYVVLIGQELAVLVRLALTSV